MKAFIQYKVNSTGYVPNSIPPVFSDEYVKPIDMLGSDGVSVLDGRLSIESMIEEAIYRISKHIKRGSIIGYEIHRGDFKRSRVVYSCTLPPQI